MKLIFERSTPGHGTSQIGPCDVPMPELDPSLARKEPLRLPEISEGDLSRHYTEYAEQTFGVNNGFYPLGSCTMKYNPKINEAMASLPGFAGLHPLVPDEDAQGILGVFDQASKRLCAVNGMDHFTFQPAAGAQGEWLGLLLIKKYHEKNGDSQRKKMIVPETAHGTNPASAVMAGFDVVTTTTDANGDVDLESLKEAIGDGKEIAGLMLTNPSTLGLFDPNILTITELVHEAGGLVYYDGANLNAIMGYARPGDMGFDVVHLNLHKTFSTPHGGGGPGSGAVGCKDFLAPFLPAPVLDQKEDGSYFWDQDRPDSVGRLKAFYGHSAVVVRALTYLMSLGADGLKAASGQAVLSANYMRVGLKESYPAAYDRICMHEYVASLTALKEETGVAALDLAKAMLDHNMHPPTMYFPLNVAEALMFEPTETESKATLDNAIENLNRIVDEAKTNPEAIHQAPTTKLIGRVDEVAAARKPILTFAFEDK